MRRQELEVGDTLKLSRKITVSCGSWKKKNYDVVFDIYLSKVEGDKIELVIGELRLEEL